MEYTKNLLVKYRVNNGYKPCYHQRTFTITIHTDELGFYTRDTYRRIVADLTDCVIKQEKTDKVTIVWYKL